MQGNIKGPPEASGHPLVDPKNAQYERKEGGRLDNEDACQEVFVLDKAASDIELIEFAPCSDLMAPTCSRVS
jgi:hypothetical protein